MKKCKKVKKFYTTQEAAEKWECCYLTIIRNIKSKKIKATKIRGRWLIPVKQIDEYTMEA